MRIFGPFVDLAITAVAGYFLLGGVLSKEDRIVTTVETRYVVRDINTGFYVRDPLRGEMWRTPLGAALYDGPLEADNCAQAMESQCQHRFRVMKVRITIQEQGRNEAQRS